MRDLPNDLAVGLAVWALSKHFCVLLIRDHDLFWKYSIKYMDLALYLDSWAMESRSSCIIQNSLQLYTFKSFKATCNSPFYIQLQNSKSFVIQKQLLELHLNFQSRFWFLVYFQCGNCLHIVMIKLEWVLSTTVS